MKDTDPFQEIQEQSLRSSSRDTRKVREWNKLRVGDPVFALKDSYCKCQSTIPFYNSFAGFELKGENLGTCEALGKH